MRKWVLMAGAVAVVVGAAIANGSTDAAAAADHLCRRAPELAQLPAETPPVQQQQVRGSDGMAVPVPSPMMAPPPPPPPPPPAPSAERDRADEALVVTGAVAKGARSAERGDSAALRDLPRVPPPPAPGYSEGQAAPPAGLLTAGDHDDLLNPLLYARYAARAARQLGQFVTGLPSVDTRRVVTIAVQDDAGRPAPFVPVRITCADGNSLTFSTVADGRVVLFPVLDRLGSQVTVEAEGVRRRVTIDVASGGQEQQLVIGRPALPVRKLDLMITLDTTGSMGDEIDYLKSELRAIVADIGRDYPGLDIRVGLVAYRDIGDDYVTRTDRLTGNFGTIQASLNHTTGEGGGDMPEAMDQALVRAVDQDWRPDAVKTMLLVADAPPHDELEGKAFAAAEAARARRIQIVPVAASGVDDRAEYFMRAVAAATQSRYVFLTDDSGIGNPHAEPDVDCYVVTQLATAIRRVIASQISGQRVEPYPQEVIRVLGRYDHGKCVLPPDFAVQ